MTSHKITKEKSKDRDGQGSTVLEIRNTSVTFDMEHGESKVLDSVNLDLHRNEILGVVGESGSGKSMLADSLVDAIDNPGKLEGQITYYPEDGQPVDVLSQTQSELKDFRWAEVSMVFQGALASFNPTMQIKDHFEETLEAHDVPVEQGMERARELLSDLYLDPERVFPSYGHELSGGMKQRVSIALSLLLNPEVLVMDEPTAALDLLMQRSIISLLERIKKEYEITIVFITHDLELIASLADRIAVMYAFDIVETGPADEIMHDAKHPYTRALINSTPNLETPTDAMKPIQGGSPSPTNVPAGCSYHPRCPMSDEHCRTSDPPLSEISATHSAACHYWTQVDSEIPLMLESFESEASQGTTVDQHIGSESTDKPLVSLKDVCVHFEPSSGLLDRLFSESSMVRAVDTVDLEIGTKETVVLVGESGCGKTTLGRTVIGDQEPTGGTVKYRDQDIWDAKYVRGDVDIPFSDIRRSLQMIHQDPGSSLNPNHTIRSILARPLKKWAPHLSREDRLSRQYGLLKRVGMTPPENYIDRYPHQLSGGEKQRVALARTLLMNPDLIMADEALSALDVSLRVDMMDLFVDLQNEFETSFVFVSHNLSNARYLAKRMDGRIGIMYLGELVEIGKPEEILRNPSHPYTQALKWATPNLDPDTAKTGDPPIRKIDIPDPIDPPSGCRFHTRCPEAREICTQEHPELKTTSKEGNQVSACFRAFEDDHPYWESESIAED